MNIKDVVNKIFYYYETYGSNDYIGEPVSQIEHMVQGAMFAEQDHQPSEIILAMFLHDIGHLLVEGDYEVMGELGIQNHELKGKQFLEQLGIPYPIPQLVENHVVSKRYLVSKNPEYYNNLSDASKQTLEFQGGPMSPEQMLKFELDPLFESSLLVRSYDERSKETDMKINSLDYYKGFLTSYLLSKHF